MIWRRLRARFGAAAPKVSIRAELPFYWRAIAVIVLSACAIALAGWIYDAGLRFAGYHQEQSTKELNALRARASELESRLAELSRVATSSESRVRIESTAQELLAKQLKAVEEENARLRSDLAMFENLAGADVGNGSLAISRLQVTPDEVAGRYRYRLLIAQKQDKKDREFKGSLRLEVRVQRNSETVMIPFPGLDAADFARFEVAFRYFHRLEGTFEIPRDARLLSVNASLLEKGIVRATQSLQLESQYDGGGEKHVR